MHSFSSTEKHAPNGVTFTDMRDMIPALDDRATYYTEDFDGGLGGWVNNIATGGVGFESTSTGHANDAGSTFFIPALLTSTPTAWVLVDSDSDGSSGTEEMATLTSPIIDLVAGGLVAGGPPYPLKVEMEQFYAGWQMDTIFLEVSDDGGGSWNQIEIMNNSVGREGRPNPELVSINITPYVIDPTQLRLRFRWHGNWDYGWQFDNVTVLDLPDYDLKISKVFRGDWTALNPLMYSYVPEEQATEFVIGADIKNIGYLDLTNCAFDWEILDPTLAVVASGTSGTLANLANNENDTVWVSTGFTPTDLGTYTINFTAVSDFAEAVIDEGNNSLTDDYFELTDYTYGADYSFYTGAFYGWSSDPDGSASAGNIFQINADGVIGGVTAELDDFADVVDQLIYYAVYLWDGAAFALADQTADYTTTAADEGEFVTLYFDTPVDVVTGDFALVVAGHYGGTTHPGFEMAGQVPPGQVQGTDAGGATVSLLNPSSPVVRALMHDFTAVEEHQSADAMHIYPNPANDLLTVNMTLAKADNTVITVMDLSGKVVKTVSVGNVNGTKNINLNIDDLSSGAYFIQVSSQQGKMTQKFIKK